MLPEILAAAGIAVNYCAQPDIFPEFLEWITSQGDLESETEGLDYVFFSKVPDFILLLADFADSFNAEDR